MKMCQNHANPRTLILGSLIYSEIVIRYADRITIKPYACKNGTITKKVILLHCITASCDNSRDIYTIDPEKRDSYKCSACSDDSLRSLRPYESTFNQWKSITLKHLQKKKQIVPFSVTYEQFAQVCDLFPVCFYCRKPLRRKEKNTKKHTYGYFGSGYMDRVVPELGYVLGNLVACCAACNHTKGKWLCKEEMQFIASLRRGKKTEAFRALDANIHAVRENNKRIRTMSAKQKELSLPFDTDVHFKQFYQHLVKTSVCVSSSGVRAATRQFC